MQLVSKIILVVFLLSASNFVAQEKPLSSLLIGSWSVEAVRYFDGKESESTRTIEIMHSTLRVYEHISTNSNLLYEGKWRLDSLDSGNFQLVVELNVATANSTCNTLILQIDTCNNEFCLIHWFENFYIAETEKLSYYYADCRITKTN